MIRAMFKEAIVNYYYDCGQFCLLHHCVIANEIHALFRDHVNSVL